ncbi:MAG: hypothetical protein Q7T71_12995, partial [Herbiconiux sp.]|nr:hypothetical protein [Herbiconiux sp.]
MSVSSAPRSSRLAPVVIVGIVAGLLSSVIVAAPAQAMLGNCRLETRWTSDGSRNDGSNVIESGIRENVVVACDAVSTPWHGWADGVGGDDWVGGLDTVPVTTEPVAAGAASPPPPPSDPAGAAPPCIAGANNDPNPGSTADRGTGDGDVFAQNLQRLVDRGDVRLISPGASRFVSFDVNVGPSMMAGGANPLDGLGAEEAFRDLLWPGYSDPTYSEVGAVGSVARAFKYALRAAGGNQRAMAQLENLLIRLDGPTRRELATAIENEMTLMMLQYRTSVPPAVQDFLWELKELTRQILMMVSDPTPVDAAQSYHAVNIQPEFRGGTVGDSGSACGQIGSVSLDAAAGLTPGASWIHVTLQGTAHGTLIDRIQAMTPSAVSCSSREIEVIGDRLTMTDVTSGCSGDVVGARLLTRAEAAALPAAERARLLEETARVPGAESVFDFSTWVYDGRTPSWATSSFGSPADHFSRVAGEPVLEYTALTNGVSRIDHVVVAAEDADGVEHPFIVSLAVKAAPTCPVMDGPVGPITHGFRPTVTDGTLQVMRNVPFTLDLKRFCQTDHRDAYRVVMGADIPGTTHAVNPDGTVTFTWTDPDIVGDHLLSFDLTAWDETTGAPSATKTVTMSVRDARPLCNDVEVEYDRSERAGAPMTIPIDCGMEGGIRVLHPAFVRIDDSPKDGYEREVEGGVFRSDGTTVTFTPSTTPAEVSTVQLSPWDADPTLPARYHTHGAFFSVDVR